MQTKEYLSQISRLDRMIQNKLGEINQLKTIACNVTMPNDGERVQTSPDKDKVGAIVAKIVDMEKEVDGMIDKYIDLKKEICIKIGMLKSEKHREILYKKYIKEESIYLIAEELKMTDRGCKKAHKRALEEFKKMNENTKCCISIDSTPQNMV